MIGQSTVKPAFSAKAVVKSRLYLSFRHLYTLTPSSTAIMDIQNHSPYSNTFFLPFSIRLRIPPKPNEAPCPKDNKAGTQNQK